MTFSRTYEIVVAILFLIAGFWVLYLSYAAVPEDQEALRFCCVAAFLCFWNEAAKHFKGESK